MTASIAAQVLATQVSTNVLPYALVAGALATVVAAACAFLTEPTRPGVIGLPVALATLVTLREKLGAPYAPVLLFAATIVIFVGGELASRMDDPIWWAAPVVGGVMMAATNIPAVPILGRVGAAIAAVGTGALLADFDRRHASQGLGVILAVITCAAPMFLTPGNDAGAALVGASIVMLLLLIPAPWARIGGGGAYALALVYWWVVLISAGWIGPGGGDNLVAAFVACGFFAFEPPARYFMRKLSGMANRLRSTRDSLWLVLITAAAAQGAVVVYAAAVVARFDAVDRALLAALPVVVGGMLVAVEVVPSPRRQARRPHQRS